MKILFIAGQAIRSNSSVTMMNLGYINGFVQAGHDVRVITSKLPNNHIATDIGFEIPESIVLDEYDISPAFNILSSKQKKNDNKNFIIGIFKKMIRKLYYKISIYDSTKSWVNSVTEIDLSNEFFDLVISLSDPKHSHLFAQRLLNNKRVRCNKWVQLWGDPMYLDITRKGILFRSRLFKEEERLISNADKVIYVSPFTAIEQKKNYPNYSKKIDYVLIPYFRRDETTPKNFKNKKIVFGYYGDYDSKIRNLKPLYDAAVESKSILKIRGNSDKPFKSTSYIDVKSRVILKELEEIEEETDVLVHLCNSKGTQIPAKVYYYSGTKKPILFILDGETEKIKKFFEPFERYIFCENNKEDILHAMNRILEIIEDGKDLRIVDELSPVSIVEEMLRKIEVADV